jgi:MFS family permease
MSEDEGANRPGHVAVSTMAVGLLPTYAQAGVWAPVLLVVLRLIQGFAVAGEISGASSMILEHAPFGRRGYFASLTLQGVQAGQILAAAVFLSLSCALSKEAFLSWGWRVPFLRRNHHPPRSRGDAGLP